MHGNRANQIFNQSIDDYHKSDSIHTPLTNPYASNSIEGLLYQKNWIDTVQWHLEDEIRSPTLGADGIVSLKRWIDRSNQERTDTVEKIDDHFLELLKDSKPQPGARMNSETPAWLLDRLSILCLKIYHMRDQTLRSDVSVEHKAACESKLSILLEQQTDLTRSFDELIEDIQSGKRFMKVYRQMKMYNDPNLNPVLYKKS